MAITVLLATTVVASFFPGVANAAPAQTTSIKGWKVSGPTASGTLPGTLASEGSAQLTTDGKATIDVLDSDIIQNFPTTDTVAANQDCLAGVPLWGARDCFTRKLTFTLPTPIVNPELRIGPGVGSWTEEAVQSSCAVSWENIEFTAINGSLATAGSLEPRSIGRLVKFQSNSLNLDEQAVKDLGPCNETPGAGFSTFIVKGLVKSIELTMTSRSMVTQSFSDTRIITFSGGIFLAASVPNVDLEISKTGPEQISAGQEINWDLTVTNNGGSDSHGFLVKDAIPSEVQNAQLVSAPEQCSLVGSDLVCNPAPETCSIAKSLTAPQLSQLTCPGNYLAADQTILKAGGSFGPIKLKGTARSNLQPNTVISNTATVAGVDSDPEISNNTSTAETDTVARLLVLKRFPSGRLAASDQIDLSVENSDEVLGTARTSGSETGLQNQNPEEYIDVPVKQGTTLSIAEEMAPASESSLENYSTTWACYATGLADARALWRSGSGNSFSFDFPELPFPNATLECEFSNDPFTWDITKTATVAGAEPGSKVVSPGDQINYTVTASNPGSGDIEAVVLTDDLSGVTASADFVEGSARLKVADASVQQLPDPDLSAEPALLTSPSFVLPAGKSATLTYSVKVKSGAWLANLTNRVSGTGGKAGVVPPANCSPSETVQAQQCSTTHTTNALIEIEKTASNGSTRLDGSAFELLADNAGEPGAVLAQHGVTRTAAGLFQVANLPVGTYWLREAAAPDGYNLLAQEVRFEIAGDGSVSILGNQGNAVTSAANRIKVKDVAAFRLPATGGSGPAPIMLAGLVLLAGCAALVLHRRLSTNK